MDLTEAREKRGWTFHRAAQAMRGVSEQQLRNLEGIGAQRVTDPLNARLGTVIEILRVYHPDVDLNDLAGVDTGFYLRRGKSRSKKRQQPAQHGGGVCRTGGKDSKKTGRSIVKKPRASRMS